MNHEVRVTLITSYNDDKVIRAFVSVGNGPAGPAFTRFVDVDRGNPKLVVASSMAWGADGPPQYVIDTVDLAVREHLSQISRTP